MKSQEHPASHAADTERRCTAFVGVRRVAAGPLEHVALAVKSVIDDGELAPILIFDDATASPVDIDFRGTEGDVRAYVHRTFVSAPKLKAEPAVSPEKPRGPGRPRLGVVAREVTLLPRHWDWLGIQPGGASAALRRLVDEARRANVEKDRVRLSQEAACRFMTAVAGNLPGYEDATRALFAGHALPFDDLIAAWPGDVRDYARTLAADALAAGPVAGPRSRADR
jgi:hypothetical protein